MPRPSASSTPGAPGGVAAADRVTHAEGPAVMLSQDLQDGIASLQRDGLGHATFQQPLTFEYWAPEGGWATM
jgi:hypothetical protein